MPRRHKIKVTLKMINSATKTWPISRSRLTRLLSNEYFNFKFLPILKLHAVPLIKGADSVVTGSILTPSVPVAYVICNSVSAPGLLNSESHMECSSSATLTYPIFR